ncbi:hypothetical protein HUJ04_005474 [Dendroctonus ponderosae]|nr:hypothetical protein HUJ04_005474 [Dendroctonus ponderosae]KAH1004445.1 hypothetical protein HUJ05_005257 [Dendroctonus ponderosae]
MRGRAKSQKLQKSPLVSAPSPNLTPIPQLRGSRGPTPRSSSPPVLPHGLPRGQNWSAVCLRPTAPLRPCLALGAAPGGPYQRYNSRRATTYKEDGQILDVIEAYCTLGKPRCTLTSVEVLTGGNVQLPNKLMSSHRSSLELIAQPLQPRRFRPHGPPRASTWCCGSFVAKQLKKSQHLE